MLGRLGRAALGVALVATTLVMAAGASPVAAAPTSPLAGWHLGTLPLLNGGIAHDALRGQVLVAVRDEVPGLGNHLVEVDPTSGALGRRVVVGSDPGQVEVAPDGSRAFVALDGAPMVVEVDLASFTVTRSFPVAPQDPFDGWYGVADLAVLPGSPPALVVSLEESHGVRVLVDGIARPDVISDPPRVQQLAVVDGDTLYATSGDDLLTLEVDADGVRLVQTQPELADDLIGRITYANGRVHGDWGTVVDPVAGVVVGTYGNRGALAVAATDGLSYLLTPTARLSRHDATTLAESDVRLGFLRAATQVLALPEGLVIASPSGVQLFGPGARGGSFALPGGPESFVRSDRATELSVLAFDVAGPPSGEVVYATTRPSDTAHPESLLALDPGTGQVLDDLQLDDEPERVELSDDGEVLFVTHDDAAKVTEVWADDLTVRRTTSFAVGGNPAVAEAVTPVPGTNDRYVASLRRVGVTTRSGNVLVVGGVVQPTALSSSDTLTAMVFDGPGRLYGPSGTTPNRMYTVDVTATGLTVVDRDARIYDEPAGAWWLHDGSIHTGAGEVIDPALPRRTARYAFTGAHEATWIDPERDRAYVEISGSVLGEVELSSLTAVARHTGLETATHTGGGGVFGDALFLATSDPLARIPLATVPEAPTALTIVPAHEQLVATWAPPADDGGSDVTAYRIYIDGEVAATVAGAETGATLDGLLDGTTYEVAVSAVNGRGEGPASAGVPGTPFALPPSAPQSFEANPGDGHVSLAWQPPASDGGAPVTAYRAYVDGVQHGGDLPASARTLMVEGLVNGTAYDFQVAAVNEVGQGTKTATLTRTPSAAPPEPSFDDVGTDHPFFAEIEWAAAEGITNGYADGTFRPGGVVTRQSMAAFLHRLAGAPDAEPPGTPTFRDVGTGHPFFAEIEWAVEVGVTGGFTDRTYRPGAPVTRQSMAAFLHRMAGSPPVELPGGPTFSDVGQAHPFWEEVEWAVGEGITTGYAGGTFRPGASVTRAATAAFMQRLVAGPGVDL